MEHTADQKYMKIFTISNPFLFLTIRSAKLLAEDF